MRKSRDKFVENTRVPIGSRLPKNPAELASRTSVNSRVLESVRFRVGTSATPARGNITDATGASSTKNGTCHHLGLGASLGGRR